MKRINYDDLTKEKIKYHNPNSEKTADHPYKILLIGVSGSEKTNALLNLIKIQDEDDYSIIDLFIYIYHQNLIYILKVQMKQNINIFVKNMKKWS